MRYFLLFTIFILIGCIPGAKDDLQNTEESLESYFTVEEKRINECFKSIKFKCSEQVCERRQTKKCLEGTQYSAMVSRGPSSAMAAEMIESNSWFFNSDLNLIAFFKVLKGLVKARKDIVRVHTQIKNVSSRVLHGTGVAVSGSAYFGVGTTWTAEVINHSNDVALFCAPGNIFTTDIGVNPIGFAGVATLNCPSNQRYEGTFLSIAAGVSGEVLLVPAEATVAYSYGFNVQEFYSQVQRIKLLGFNKTELIREYRQLVRDEEYFSLNQKFILNSVGSLLSFVFGMPPVSHGFNLRGVNVRNLLRRDQSFGQIAKNYLAGTELQNFLNEKGYDNLQLITSAIASGFTGCDSIAGAATISLSLSPVVVSLEHSYYKKLLSMRMSSLTMMQGLSAFALANPFLMSPGTLRKVVELARNFTTLGPKVRACRTSQRVDLHRLLNI